MLNAQGDVIELREEDGSLRCRYTYDAWGKILSVYDVYYEYDEYVFDIAYINPLRYRGYIYDDDTDLYYCQSRYYDPQIRRFINADSLVSTGLGFNGFNMFAYCNNNPVMYSDPSGYVVSDWDREHCSFIEISQLEYYTYEWEHTTDSYYRYELHDYACRIREKYLLNDEYVMADGNIAAGTFYGKYVFSRSGQGITYEFTRTKFRVDVAQSNFQYILDSPSMMDGLIAEMRNTYFGMFGYHLPSRTASGLMSELYAHEELYQTYGGDRFRYADLEGSNYIGDKNYYPYEIAPNSAPDLTIKWFKFKEKMKEWF